MVWPRAHELDMVDLRTVTTRRSATIASVYSCDYGYRSSTPAEDERTEILLPFCRHSASVRVSIARTRKSAADAASDDENVPRTATTICSRFSLTIYRRYPRR